MRRLWRARRQRSGHNIPAPASDALSHESVHSTLDNKVSQLVGGVELGGETQTERDALLIHQLQGTVVALTARVEALEPMIAKISALEAIVQSLSSRAPSAAPVAVAPPAATQGSPTLTITAATTGTLTAKVEPVVTTIAVPDRTLATVESAEADLHRALSVLEVSEPAAQLTLQPGVEGLAVALADACIRQYTASECLIFEPCMYTSTESLLRALEPPNGGGLAPVRLVRASWIVARAQKVKLATTAEEVALSIMPRRQQLEAEEPEAFMDVDEVRQLIAPPAGEGAKRQQGTDIAALS